MNRIEKFKNFTNEGAFTSKMRRIVTGESAGEEIEKLSIEQQNKLLDMYRTDPTEAAKYLRSIIIREKNSQFGLGLALTLAGAAMIYKALDVDPPKPPHDVEGKIVKYNRGESMSEFGERVHGAKLGPNDPVANMQNWIKNDMGNGNFEEGAKNIVGHMKPGTEHDILLNNLMKLKGVDPSLDMKDVFVGDWGPHQGFAWGDLGGEVFVPSAAPHIYVTPDTIN